MFRDRFWIKQWPSGSRAASSAHNSTQPILFHFNRKDKKIEIYNYETKLVLDELNVKFIRDNSLRKEILLKCEPNLDADLNASLMDAYVFSQSEDILFIHDLRKLKQQFIDLSEYKQYFVYPSQFLVGVRSKEISLFYLHSTEVSFKDIRFEARILKCELNLNYDSVLLPTLLEKSRLGLDLLLVVLFANEIKLYKLFEDNIDLILNIPIELRPATYFNIKFERHFMLNEAVPTTGSIEPNVYVTFLIASSNDFIHVKNEGKINDELYVVNVYANETVSNISLKEVEEFIFDIKPFRIEYKEVFSMFNGYIFAVDNLRNLTIINTGESEWLLYFFPQTLNNVLIIWVLLYNK